MAAKALPDQDYLRQILRYDRESGVAFWNQRPSAHFGRSYEYKRWNARYADQQAGTIRRPNDRPHFAITIDGSDYPLHRVIWKLETGEEPIEVDHEDRDGLNNRWLNLRAATRLQNCANRVRRSASGLPTGVRPSGSSRFYAAIRGSGGRKHLGTFDTIEEASAAYKAAAAELYGEFAP